MYGYQLRTEFEQRTGSTWPLNVGQVYTTLARLERDGVRVVTGRGRLGPDLTVVATTALTNARGLLSVVAGLAAWPLSALRGIGEQQAAVEIDPVGERGDRRRAGDPDRRLLHAAEEGPEAELMGALEHLPRRAPAARRVASSPRRRRQ